MSSDGQDDPISEAEFERRKHATSGSTYDRVSFRLPEHMLAAVDEAVERAEYPNRSEALRAAVREQFLATDGGRDRDDRLKYLRTNEIRAEIAYTVGGDPSRFQDCEKTMHMRKATLVRIADQLQPDEEEFDFRQMNLSELYERLCRWAGGEYNSNAGKAWGINRDNLKLIHQAVDARPPDETSQPESERVATDGGRDPAGGPASPPPDYAPPRGESALQLRGVGDQGPGCVHSEGALPCVDCFLGGDHDGGQ